jgi:TRAP-type C4-dicarboxylate transport system substrate-binding protein
MKIKRLLLLMVSICMVLMFASIALIAEKAVCAEKAPILALSQTYNWKMTAWFPAGHNENRHLIQFIDKMKQSTDGKVKITIYESTLGAPTDHWDMLKGNVIQFAFLAEGYSIGRMPVGTLYNLPFEFTNYNDMFRIYNEWMKAGYLREMTDNFKILYFKPTSFQQLFLRNKKVTTLEGLKGLKVRALSGLQGQTIAALGAAGVSMSGGETYMGLQTGVIDGTITGIDNVVDRKFYEVCKYALQMPIYSGIWVVSMNKETWNSLPKELQTLIDDVSEEVGAAEKKRTLDADNAYWETTRKAGVEVYTISPEEQARWKKATASVDDKYLQEWAAKGHPVKEALEMMRKMASK